MNGPAMDISRPITLHLPKRIEIGNGAAARLSDWAAPYGRVLVLASRSTAAMVDRLGLPGTVTVHAPVAAEPKDTDLMAALAAARAVRPDLVVGFGGGSVMDIAKLVAVLWDSDQTPAEVGGANLVRRKCSALAQVATTAGTGSAAGIRALFTASDSGMKVAVESPLTIADVAVLDPELTMTVPQATTAATGVDALAHCVEAFTSRRAHPLVDDYARLGIGLTGRFLARAVADGADAEARSGMLLASFYGGLCLGPVNTAAGHAVAYPLGTRAGLPHGLFGTRQLRAGETAGAMDAGVARRLGLGSPIPVVTGGLDSFLSSVGSGIAEPGDACLGTGSSAVAALLARPPAAGRFAWRGLALLSRVLPLGGRALQWVQTASGEARPLEVLLQEAARLPSPRSAAALGSLLFAGADGVRAALAEALRDRGPVACCRLVLDALAVAQSRALARFEEEGLPVGRVRSVGRLAGCAEFAQLQADALGRAVEVPRETDSGPLGAAMLAAAALELAPPEAVPRMARVERVHRPRADSARAFEDAYGELLRPARGAPSLSRSGP